MNISGIASLYYRLAEYWRLNIKVVILDFDGVLVESVHIKHEAFRHLLPEYPEHIEAIMNYHFSNNGVSRYKKFRHIIEQILGLTYTEAWERDLKKRFDHLSKKRIIEAPEVQGAESFLKVFFNRIPLHLLSATPIHELKEILDGRNIIHYFKEIFGSPIQKEVALKAILEKENIVPSDAVYVGDSPEDQFASGAVGIPFIGCQSSFQFEGGDFPIFDNMFDVASHIDKLIKEPFVSVHHGVP